MTTARNSLKLSVQKELEFFKTDECDKSSAEVYNDHQKIFAYEIFADYLLNDYNNYLSDKELEKLCKSEHVLYGSLLSSLHNEYITDECPRISNFEDLDEFMKRYINNLHEEKDCCL